MKKEKETKENEKKPLMVDFGKLSVVKNFEDKIEVMDIRRKLGNCMRALTGDIGCLEFCREIYFSQGEIEVPQEYINFILYTAKENFIIDIQIALHMLLLGLTREEAIELLKKEAEERKNRTINQ